MTRPCRHTYDQILIWHHHGGEKNTFFLFLPRLSNVSPLALSFATAEALRGSAARQTRQNDAFCNGVGTEEAHAHTYALPPVWEGKKPRGKLVLNPKP